MKRRSPIGLHRFIFYGIPVRISCLYKCRTYDIVVVGWYNANTKSDCYECIFFANVYE